MEEGYKIPCTVSLALNRGEYYILHLLCITACNYTWNLWKCVLECDSKSIFVCICRQCMYLWLLTTAGGSGGLVAEELPFVVEYIMGRLGDWSL